MIIPHSKSIRKDNSTIHAFPPHYAIAEFPMHLCTTLGFQVFLKWNCFYDHWR